jgi:hypothetical protein
VTGYPLRPFCLAAGQYTLCPVINLNLCPCAFCRAETHEEPPGTKIGSSPGPCRSSRDPVQAGYRSHHPILTNIHQRHLTFPQLIGGINGRSTGRRCLSGATSANAARPDHTTPSPGGQASGMAGTQESLRLGLGGQGVASRRPPKGYHTTAQGQSHMTHAPVPSRAVPGPPRGRAAPGRRDATRAPMCKIYECH